jgi:hypothetical protein
VLSMDWDMDMLHLLKAPSSTTQPKSDNTYLKDDYDPPWKNKANIINLEHYDSLSDLTNAHHFHDKYMRH